MDARTDPTGNSNWCFPPAVASCSCHLLKLQEKLNSIGLPESYATVSYELKAGKVTWPGTKEAKICRILHLAALGKRRFVVVHDGGIPQCKLPKEVSCCQAEF